MGSFDATCIASNIRIRCGEEIYAVLLVSSGIDHNWEPVGLPILGKYSDYGLIELDNDEDGEQLVDSIRPWIIPQTGFDPATIGFYDLQDQCWNNLSVFSHLDEDEDEGIKSNEYWPYNQLNTALKAAGFQQVAKSIGQDDSNILTISTSSTSLVEIEKLETFIKEHGYEVMRVSSFGTSREVLIENRHAFDLILAPKADHPHVNTYLGFSYEKTSRPMRIGFIRKDFYDRMVPEAKFLKKAELLTEELKNHYWFSKRKEKKHILYSLQMALNLSSYDRQFSISSKILHEYIKSLPDDFSPEQLLKLIRYNKFLFLMKYKLAVGIRPIPLYVGSQCAIEDWPTQRQAHKICDEILKDLISKRDKDFLIEEPIEYEAFLDIQPITFYLEN